MARLSIMSMATGNRYLRRSTRIFASSLRSSNRLGCLNTNFVSIIECFSAEMDERAIGKDDFQAEDMRCGKAVLQAMCAAGIFRDVSANAADRLRGRIGGVEIISRRNASGDVKIDDPRFDDHAGVREIDFQDTIHSRQADDDPVFNRKRTAA